MIYELFPKSFCSTCFEQLHDDHYGWDICGTCAVMERVMCEDRGILYPPEYYSELNSGKLWDECPCYTKAEKVWSTSPHNKKYVS